MRKQEHVLYKSWMHTVMRQEAGPGLKHSICDCVSKAETVRNPIGDSKAAAPIMIEGAGYFTGD